MDWGAKIVMRIPENLIGKRFERLLVVSKAEPRGGQTYWNCTCICGIKKEVAASRIRSGVTRSCGCYRNEIRKTAQRKHGMSKSKMYRTWRSILNRCYYKKDKSFKHYGGRGIRVCRRWKRSFKNFYQDMGDKPSPLHSVERKDNNKGYSPGNCKWASLIEQHRNCRQNVYLTIGKRKKCLTEWCLILGVEYGFLKRRLEKGTPPKQILREAKIHSFLLRLKLNANKAGQNGATCG